MTWQPVKPPPEEQYLGEISLGLHTIESFDVTAPKPYEARVQDFQEMSFDALDVEKTATPEAAVPPAPKPAPEVPSPSPETPEAPEVPEPALASASGTWTELPKSPHPRPEPSGPPKQQQNRSAFETWLTRLKGGRQ